MKTHMRQDTQQASNTVIGCYLLHDNYTLHQNSYILIKLKHFEGWLYNRTTT